MLSENAVLAMGLSRAHSSLQRRLEGPLGGAHGLGFTGFQILAELASVQGGRLRGSDLAQRLSLTPSGVTRACAPLEAEGSLVREQDGRDARVSFLTITPAGRRRLEEAAATVERAVAETFSGTVTRADRLALLGLFERLGY